MGEKDLTEKILESYNDVFSDIINAFLFHGEQRVLSSSLYDVSASSMYKAEDGLLHEQERDVVKIWKDNATIAVYGIENQTKVDRLMPLRIFGYEGASYRSQLLRGGHVPVPVVTLILYFGKEHWNQPKTLKELLKVPEELSEYVNDCKIHVFEISWLTDEQINLFQSDFKVVANFFASRRKYKDYIPDDPTEITHVDSVLKLLSVMTGDHRYETILSDTKKEGGMSMCEVAERLENRGMEKGLEKGREEVIARLISKGKTPDEIHELLEYPLEYIYRVQQSLANNSKKEEL